MRHHFTSRATVRKNGGTLNASVKTNPDVLTMAWSLASLETRREQVVCTFDDDGQVEAGMSIVER